MDFTEKLGIYIVIPRDTITKIIELDTLKNTVDKVKQNILKCSNNTRENGRENRKTKNRDNKKRIIK